MLAHTSTLGGVMVDSEERFSATHTAYATPASTAQSSTEATPDALLAKICDLERALRRVQGTDCLSYQFRDLCYFPEATLPSNFHISEFEKYNG